MLIFLKSFYYLGRLLGRYQTFIADYPDNQQPQFRYPQMNSLSGFFRFNNKIDCFILKDSITALTVANKIISNEITLYELIVPAAKRIHLNDFLGYKTTNTEKTVAFFSVVVAYLKNISYRRKGKNSFNLSLQLRWVSPKDFIILDNFNALEHFQNNFSQVKVAFIKLIGLKKIFQIGVTLKGTNFVFVDDQPSTLIQEIYHCNFHLAEGIRGFNRDNKYIIETWATVPWLYAMQLVDGRIERRIRQNQSPHDIKFIDYIFWRAYIGQGYVLREKEISKPIIFHGVYGLIAPTAKLLFEALDGNHQFKNNLIINSIFKGSAPEIKSKVNEFWGNNYFNKIYHNFDLFSRLEVVNEIITNEKLDKNKIYKILFNPEELVPTLLDYKLTALIWLSNKINQNKKLIINLLEDYYNKQLANNSSKITIESWINYLNKTNKRWAIEVISEYAKNKDIINSL